MARRTNGVAAVRIEREQRELQCDLTESEVRQRGESLATARLEIEQLKQTRKGINGQIADLDDQILKLANVVDQKHETRMVQCTWSPDYASGMTVCTRDDTGVAIEQRALTAADKQGSLQMHEYAPQDANA